jgi:capsular polysaccharide biosynthesis protein
MSVEDPAVRGDQVARVSSNGGPHLPERLWTYDDFTAAEAMPVEAPAGLVSLAFIRAAIRRSASLVCALALVGLLIGLGVSVTDPPAYQASTSLLLTYGPYENALSAPNDDQAIAQSRTVAGLALHQLGLRQSVSSFLAAYTVTIVSNRVLQITASAPSGNDAVSRANAVATAFLRFRVRELEAEQNLVLASLNQQIDQAKQKINTIGNQISQLNTQAASSQRRARLSVLQGEHSQAVGVLTTLEQTTQANPAASATALAVKGSVVLDAATPMPHSRLKPLLFDAVVGLVLGLAVGLGIVVVRALCSDRLRRRDDVAHALGAPVQLSVGPVRLSRWLPGKRGLAAAQDVKVERVTAHLAHALPPSPAGAATLAVIPVDDPQVAALALVSLALFHAQRGLQVVVADLCPGAPAARLMEARDPGVHPLRLPDADRPGAELVVVIPDPQDVAPAGPLDRPGDTRPGPYTDSLAGAYSHADLLLTLAALDPSAGCDYLRGWAPTAVAVVTAGRSSATRIHAAGESLRLAGIRLDSAVLVGADGTDESLGVIRAPGVEYRPDLG